MMLDRRDSVRSAFLTKRSRALSWPLSRTAIVWIGLVASAPVCVERSRLPAQESDPELLRQQRDVGLILEDVVRRMERLAGTLEPSQPEEARKLREAAERVRTAGMDRLLEEITALLASSNFVGAVGRQDRALEELDRIISLLEESRFRNVASDDAKLNEEALREVAELAGRQEQLLDTTRRFLDSKKAADMLGKLAQQLAGLGEQQEGLNRGESSERLDPEGERDDARALQDAVRSVEDLLRRQGDILERFRGLPDDQGALRRAQAMARRLEELAAEAEAAESSAAESPATEADRPEDPGGQPKPSKESPEGGRTPGGAQRLQEAIEALERELSKEGPLAGGETAREATQKAVKDADRAARGSGEKVSEPLRDAQRALQEGVRKAEDDETRRTAPLVQDEGLLEEATTAQSERLEQSAQKAGSDASRSALREGATGLRKAAESMRRFASELSQGRREEAGQAGAQAQQELREAQSALQEGQDSHAGRSPGQKAADLQQKLAEKTDAAEKQVEELQRKLGRKEPERDRELDGLREALGKAAGSMRAGAQSRQAGREAEARQHGQDAAEQLELARKLAEQGQERQPDPETLRAKKDEQDELARLTRKTAQKLATGTRAGQRQSENVGSAAESMDQAGEDLGREEAEQAEQEQEEALSKLREARDALDRESEELARLNREREVTSVIQQLTEIRQQEESVFAETVQIQAGRAPDEGRRERLLLRRAADRLATTQTGIADKVDGLRGQLQDETSRVFAFVLGNVSADMREIVESLGDLEFGEYTQFLQREVLSDLDQLLDVMKRELENLQRQQQQQGSMPPMPAPDRRRLVPIVAELRMLAEMQGDVNRKTRDLEDLRDASGGNTNDGWDRSLDRLMQKQGSVSRLTGKLVEDFEKLRSGPEQSDPEGAGEGAKQDEP